MADAPKFSKWQSRKWIAAVFAALFATAALYIYAANIKEPNAAILASAVIPSCLAIIVAATTTQGIHDQKWGEGYNATMASGQPPVIDQAAINRHNNQ